MAVVRLSNSRAVLTGALPALALRCAAYHMPTRVRMKMPTSEPAANQATLDCPRGSTMKAAKSGPMAEPTLPPT
jgi:hypothetical protein